MEVGDGNREHVIDGIEEHVCNENADNDSCAVDLEVDGKEPYVGMEFVSQENAYSFYSDYAKVVGFGISTKHSRRSKVSKQFIDVTYACTRYGKKRESIAQNPRPCLKVECEASFRIKRNCDGNWIVHNFIKDHNHELFPAYAHYFPCHRGINKAQKLSHVWSKHGDFMMYLNRCIYKSWSEQQFEDSWHEMVEKFQLSEDAWIHSLYEEREHWVPVYMKDTFFGGLSTTQRSESINSFFDKYVCKKTTLREFVEKYKVALQDREEAEMQADFNTWHKQPVLRTPSPFEKQMSMIYTHEVFKKFQVEVLGLSGCHIVKEHKDNQVTTFEIFDFQKNEEFVVECDVLKEQISCICHLFEYNGYLCRHSLMALQTVGVFAVPPHYILRRWTKDVRSKHHKRKMKEDVCSSKERYDHLYQNAIELLEEGSLSFESYDFACHALEEALKQCVTINQSLKIDKEKVSHNNLREKPLRDPQEKKTKGAPRRMKSGIEKGRKRTSNDKLKKVRIFPLCQNFYNDYLILT
ncbi:FRS (FAR1 Related Sequences) transcription factor family [Trifolium repens]|nr:FRS (FAR1 Related Sequences) transcription factor family [Trifolium repens]